jgi:hypothetical protein
MDRRGRAQKEIFIFPIIARRIASVKKREIFRAKKALVFCKESGETRKNKVAPRTIIRP